ncbi:KGK domain protein [Lyngbya aestuarii BL J]|uniref:KGK domain protein n=1 Tax=Lyngbya aestuarii BL J TaxID=1348334 RepID=U7QFW1_9CYAN|nr:KGK domain-containing protein [Lyngbya aestuarii]ERT06167.1 KGK domain protein [Lyngbya aestuarii BL J]
MSQFELLNDDTAILMIYQDTFTVARLKELASNKLNSYLTKKYGNSGISLTDLFCNSNLSIIESEVKISMNDIQLIFPTDGIECKLLNFDTRQWTAGKIKIIADVKFSSSFLGNDHYRNVKINELKLEFATDEPPLSDIETSLDEFRKQNQES